MSGVLNDYPPNYNENMEMAEIEKPIEESDGQVLMTYNPMLSVFSLTVILPARQTSNPHLHINLGFPILFAHI